MPLNLPTVFSASSLKGTWSRSRDASRPGGPGVDGVRADVFSSRLATEIETIRRLLRANSYTFSPLRTAPVPKKSGKLRIIAIPTVRDRLVQRAILRHLEGDPKYPKGSSISFGFRKGRSLQDAQAKALELRTHKPWVLQADIVQFFDRLDREDLKKRVRKNVRSKTVGLLLERIIDSELETSDPFKAALAKANGIVAGQGLRQGMPVSPALSNLALASFDRSLEKLGLAAIRYADDIAVFGSTKDACIEALTAIQALLEKLGLEVPELQAGGKTTLKSPTDTVEFLGVEIRRTADGYKLCAPWGALPDIKLRMDSAATLTACLQQKRTFGQVQRTLSSMIDGHRGALANVSDADDFLERLVAHRGLALNALVIELIGAKAAAALSDGQKAVLGLAPFP